MSEIESQNDQASMATLHAIIACLLRQCGRSRGEVFGPKEMRNSRLEDRLVFVAHAGGAVSVGLESTGAKE